MTLQCKQKVSIRGKRTERKYFLDICQSFKWDFGSFETSKENVIVQTVVCTPNNFDPDDSTLPVHLFKNLLNQFPVNNEKAFTRRAVEDAPVFCIFLRSLNASHDTNGSQRVGRRKTFQLRRQFNDVSTGLNKNKQRPFV